MLPLRPRPSRPTWARLRGCAQIIPPALPPRASSRRSPRPVRPSALSLPNLSLPRSPRRGNPSRCPTTMLWSAVLPAMRAGTICPRSTCPARLRRPNLPQRPPQLRRLPPQATTPPRLPGSPTPVRAVRSATKERLRAFRRPRTRLKPSSAASSASPPSSNRWSSCAGGYTAQEDNPLNGASL